MLRYRIHKSKLNYNVDGTPIRKYSNLDPVGDRPSYDMLQINNEYLGYKGIVYTPIDVPILQVDTQQVYDLRTSEALLEQYPGTTFGCGHGAGEVLFLKRNHFNEPEANGEWFGWVEKEMPHVKDFIEKLPYKSIRQLAFVAPPGPTRSHYDEPFSATKLMIPQSPSCYRIRWSHVTQPENEVFYLSRDSEATKIYPMLPLTTTTFVYDGSVWEHGADKGFPMHDRCQIIISGILDIEKHHALLDKSIEKYKDYVIYDG